jgi:hypothetical protein
MRWFESEDGVFDPKLQLRLNQVVAVVRFEQSRGATAIF